MAALLAVGHASAPKAQTRLVQLGSALRGTSSDAAAASRSAKLRAVAAHHAEQRFPLAALDNQEVASMDRVGAQDASSAVTAGSDGAPPPGPGMMRRAIYIPPYLYPDAFPEVSGSPCVCQAPESKPPTKEQLDWARTVAESLGLTVSQVLGPTGHQGLLTCDCGSAPANGQVTRWVRDQPLAGSAKFQLTAADRTVGHVNYWRPDASPGGLVAPMDALPDSDYPLQAKGDRVAQEVIDAARGDRVPANVARYMGQSDQRRACDGVSRDCTELCKAGDKVSLLSGNLQLKATVVSLAAGGGVQVKFSPSSTALASDAVPCPLEAGCSNFRPCRPVNSAKRCAKLVAENKLDLNGFVKTTLTCPKDTVACGTVKQVVQPRFLQKGGKMCRVA